MRDLFPKMRECPDGGQLIAGWIYWFVYEIVLPFALVLICVFLGVRLISAYTCYCVINLISTLLIFGSYLKGSFWKVRLYKKQFFISVGMGVAVFSGLELCLLIVGAVMDEPLMFVCVPVAESMIGIGTAGWLMALPGMLPAVLLLLAPIPMCCLYYAVGFARPCRNHAWLGYLIVALMSVVPAVLLVVFTGSGPVDGFAYFAAMLLFHLCACWVYQRSDTIWGPIVFHAAVSLLWLPVVIRLLPDTVIVEL